MPTLYPKAWSILSNSFKTMEPNFRITSLVAFAILFVLTGCNVVFSKDCNVTRRLAAELFKRPGGGDNSTKAGTLYTSLLYEPVVFVRQPTLNLAVFFPS